MSISNRYTTTGFVPVATANVKSASGASCSSGADGASGASGASSASMAPTATSGVATRGTTTYTAQAPQTNMASNTGTTDGGGSYRIDYQGDYEIKTILNNKGDDTDEVYYRAKGSKEWKKGYPPADPLLSTQTDPATGRPVSNASGASGASWASNASNTIDEINEIIENNETSLFNEDMVESLLSIINNMEFIEEKYLINCLNSNFIENNNGNSVIKFISISSSGPGEMIDFEGNLFETAPVIMLRINFNLGDDVTRSFSYYRNADGTYNLNYTDNNGKQVTKSGNL